MEFFIVNNYYTRNNMLMQFLYNFGKNNSAMMPYII